MSDELQRIMAIDNPYLLLREVTTRLADAQEQVRIIDRHDPLQLVRHDLTS